MTDLAELIRGRGAHVDPVSCLEDLPAELAGRRVSGLPHTVWQLLVHLNYWMSYELKCIEGPEIPYPEHAAESWPEADGPSSAPSWRDEIARFRTFLEQLTALANARASTLARIVRRAKGETVETVLWQLIAHQSYHIGQIVQVRQALGSWPPAAGGDTW